MALRCCVDNCKGSCTSTAPMCANCWALVPQTLQARVLAGYTPPGSSWRACTGDYLRAYREAQAAVGAARLERRQRAPVLPGMF